MKKLLFALLLFVFPLFLSNSFADDGYRLWLKYDLISNKKLISQYKQIIKGWIIEGDSPAIKAAKYELQLG